MASALHDLVPSTSEENTVYAILQEKYRDYHLQLPQPQETEKHTTLF